MLLLALTRRVEDASTVFAVLDLVALAFLAACVLAAMAWLAVPSARPAARRLARLVGSVGGWAAFAVAATCTGGSLWLSEAGGLRPCELCWFQRICMYPLALVTGVAALRRDRSGLWYALPLAIVGAGLSTYHYLLEWYPSLEGGSGCDPLNPCTIVWFRRFGFASIPFMALTGFVTIAVLVALAARHVPAGRPAAAARRPTLETR